jgi:hypothetical protein
MALSEPAVEIIRKAANIDANIQCSQVAVV